MTVCEPRQETRGQAAADANRSNPEPDRQPPGDGPGGIARGSGCAIQHPEGLTSAVEENLTGRRERDSAARALQQLDSKCHLELADLGAEDLLHDVDPARCRRETRFLGDSHEVAKMAHLDVHHGRS
jgi:hypothetical protein